MSPAAFEYSGLTTFFNGVHKMFRNFSFLLSHTYLYRNDILKHRMGSGSGPSGKPLGGDSIGLPAFNSPKGFVQCTPRPSPKKSCHGSISVAIRWDAEDPVGGSKPERAIFANLWNVAQDLSVLINMLATMLRKNFCMDTEVFGWLDWRPKTRNFLRMKRNRRRIFG